ncbi:MAG: Vitamin B12-dependent ribonucleotide reductase [candidate division WS2 bacterium]|uniref:ribonucleoside-diphosphate reductase n=1 Tax=Psychracetigena formicireducens TaxID=2986056 RepID=A0A9E2BG80_PSYF1|nr:Vitamin B12-dependent ribonucleotide reductase [Candidatus Psychracetigena formicireducens]
MAEYNLYATKGPSRRKIPLRELPEGDLVKSLQLAGVNIPPQRKRLSATRESITHKFSIAGHEGYLTVGLYQEGRPGETFITMAKEGSTVGGLMDAFGTSISLCLQYGVPLRVLIEKYRGSRFEPQGHTENPEIAVASSITDYIVRWMGKQFLPEDVQRELNLNYQPSLEIENHD